MDPLHYQPAIHYEIRMVSFTLKQLGLSDRAGQVRDMQRMTEGSQRRLSFAAFAECFPTFPIVLFTKGNTADRRSLPGVTARQIARVVTDFENSWVAQRFCHLRKLEASRRKGRAMGMIFPFGRVHGGWILHDGSFDTPRDPQRMNIETPVGVIRFERFLNVLKYVRASHWDPNIQPLPSAPAIPDQSSLEPLPFDLGLPIPPYIRQVLGRSIEAEVLALIWQFQTRKLPGRLCNFIQRQNDKRYVVIREDRIAKVLGVSLRSVQSAIRELRDREMLLVDRGIGSSGNPNGYSISDDFTLNVSRRGRYR
jgi:hypothetical protein